MTVADGMSRDTSSAWLGPERARRGRPGLLGDDLGRPLQRAQLVALGQRELQRPGVAARRDPAWRPRARPAWARRRRPAPSPRAPASSMATKRISAGSTTPGRKCGFSCVALSSAASSRVSVSTCTSWPRAHEQPREGAAPAPRADDRDVHGSAPPPAGERRGAARPGELDAVLGPWTSRAMLPRCAHHTTIETRTAAIS